jgi:hypothetical protein
MRGRGCFDFPFLAHATWKRCRIYFHVHCRRGRPWPRASIGTPVRRRISSTKRPLPVHRLLPAIAKAPVCGGIGQAASDLWPVLGWENKPVTIFHFPLGTMFRFSRHHFIFKLKGYY